MSKRGNNIYKRKDGRWEARYTKGYLPNGKIHYGYCYGKTYREAKEKVEKIKMALISGTMAPCEKNKKPFSLYCDRWLLLHRNRVKESTFVKYANSMEKHIKPMLGTCLPGQLTAVKIEQFSNTLLHSNHLSAKTVHDILLLVKSVLKYTEKEVENMPHVEISYPKETKKEMRVLSKEEQINFINYLSNETDDCKFGVLLALMTGMRIGELCALKWSDISFENMTVSISSTMQRIRNLERNADAKTKIVISNPKSATSARVIPLSEYTGKLCKSRPPHPGDAFVLTGKTNQYIEPRALQYKFKRYTEECGLQDVTFHTLRHTFATRCVEVGFEIKSLSEVLGHSSPKITLERYVHSSIELKRDNMNKLSAIGF